MGLAKNVSLTPNPSPKERGTIHGYVTSNKNKYDSLKLKARYFRKNQTEAEAKLWKELRKLRPGYIFRRQHIINNFVVDFVCLQKGLIVEVDGDIHNFQIERDLDRTSILKDKGFVIIRFRNEDINKNLKFVLSEIEKALKLSLDRKLF